MTNRVSLSGETRDVFLFSCSTRLYILGDEISAEICGNQYSRYIIVDSERDRTLFLFVTFVKNFFEEFDRNVVQRNFFLSPNVASISHDRHAYRCTLTISAVSCKLVKGCRSTRVNHARKLP